MNFIAARFVVAFIETNNQNEEVKARGEFIEKCEMPFLTLLSMQ